MKNNVVVVFLIILVTCFCALAFYFWFIYFLNLGSDGNLSGLGKENGLIVLVDENKIYATFDEGIEQPINVEGYKFRVENRSNKSVRYNLVFTEISPNQVNDGCSKKTSLKPEELNYQLLFANKVLSEGRVDQISNDIFESRNISENSSNSYELKVWLNSSSSDNEGKHYHYKVELKVVE